MSQNHLVTTSSHGQVRVAAGWDRPLRKMFCRVEFLDQVEEASYPWHLLETSYQSVDQIVENLGKAGIHLPEAMVSALRDDTLEQAGNIIREFRPDGVIVRVVDQQERGFSARPR